jgi:hypothetical protein
MPESTPCQIKPGWAPLDRDLLGVQVFGVFLEGDLDLIGLLQTLLN